MANLPDINIADVGIIAFWNAEDHKTAGVVDPTDCTGVFTNYLVYDNGLDGDISLGSGRLFNCRVKNDGWCVAWIDRTNTFGYPNKPSSDFGESGYKGYYDILWNWLSYFSPISSTLTTLSYIISLFELALETSGDFTFVSSNVGHYCYEYTDASVLTLLGLLASVPAEIGTVQYTMGTTLYYASVTAAKSVFGGAPQDVIKFENNILVSGLPAYYATADVLAENWMPDALTDYDLWVYAANGSLLILWS
jgi:hypothetical protein